MADALTLPYWLRTTGAQPHGAHRRALRDDSGELTFAGLADAMDTVATGLRDAGLEPGDRVVTAMEPSIPHTVVILGALAAGLVAAPLNARLTGTEARSYLTALRPRLVVADPAHAPLAHETGHRVVELPAAAEPAPVAHRTAPLSGDRRPLPPLAEDDLAVVFATGGTTGTPKGAYHTHRSLWLWLNTCAHGNPRTPADIELFFSPFFHITLGTNLLAPLLAGGEVWIQRRFDAGAALAAIDEGASRLMGAPTMFTALRAHPSFATARRENVTAIRFGSAPSTDGFVRGLLHDFPRGEDPRRVRRHRVRLRPGLRPRGPAGGPVHRGGPAAARRQSPHPRRGRERGARRGRRRSGDRLPLADPRLLRAAGGDPGDVPRRRCAHR